MSEPSKSVVELDITIHVFTVSATLVGVCLTVIGIMRRLGGPRAAHIGQELLAFDAFLFLICCIVSYMSLKINSTHRFKQRLAAFADNLFILSLSLMAVICSLIVYEIV